jgi:hypothetical protein
MQVVLNLGAQDHITDTVLFQSCLVRDSPQAGIWVLYPEEPAKGGGAASTASTGEGEGVYAHEMVCR